jgi:hypothetical protein
MQRRCNPTPLRRSKLNASRRIEWQCNKLRTHQSDEMLNAVIADVITDGQGGPVPLVRASSL